MWKLTSEPGTHVFKWVSLFCEFEGVGLDAISIFFSALKCCGLYNLSVSNHILK